MSRYYSYIDTTVGLGSTTVDGMLSNGNEYGVVPSIDIVARNITATGAFIGTLGNDNSLFSDIRVTGIATIGIVTGAVYYGDGSNLTGIDAGGFGPNDSINTTGIITASAFHGDGSNLTGITATGSEVGIKDSGSLVGTASTINFGTNLSVSPISNGVVTVTASGGFGPNDSINTTGIITASSFYGDGSNLTGIGTFSGNYNDLSNKPTIPTNNNQLSNGAEYVTSSGTVALAQGLTGTPNITAGVVNATSFIGDGSGLTGISTSGASVSVSATAPSSPTQGDLWYDSGDGRTYIYYTDSDSSQWVDASPATSGLTTDISANNLTVSGISTFGSASFAGNVVSDSLIRSDRYATKVGLGLQLGGTNYTFGAYVDSNNPVATIGLDGSATFASGTVNVSLTSNQARLNVSRTASGKAFAITNTSTSTESVTILGNGSASFAGGQFDIDSNGVIQTNIYSSGILSLDSSGTFGSPKIQLKSNDGSATFAGNVISGLSPLDGAGVGAALGPGYVNATRTNANESVWRSFIQGSNAATVNITAAGAATFAGDVTVGDYQSGTAGKNGFQFRSSGELVQNRNGGDAYTLYNNSATKTVTIQASGSATFKGNVNVGDTTSSSGGTQISAAGYLYLRSAAGDAATPVIDVYNLNNTKRASINADGSIVTRSSLSAADGYSGINASGTIYANRSTGSAVLFSGATYGGAVTSSITAAGAATFSGSVISGSLAPGGGGGNYLAVGEVAAYSPAANNHVWRGWNASSSPNVNTSQIFANGNATFTGNITANGTVLTSDSRFKENITPAKPQLADVVALGGILKNYNWNEDAPVNDEIRATRQIGLIAQEVEAICPSITKDIARTKQGAELTPAEVDSEGVETKAATYEQLDDSYKGISTDALIMKLIGAVTELTAKVEELESRE